MDIVGPDGFGDAHFVSPDNLLAYKILYANQFNNTLPVQKVSIKFQLDSDLDFSTFRFDKLYTMGNTYEPLVSVTALQVFF